MTSIIGCDLDEVLAELGRLQESAGEIGVPALVSARDALASLREAIKGASAAINDALIASLHEPQQVGDRMFSVQAKGQMRADHSSIREFICVRARFDPATGAELPASAAAENAATLVFDAYVSRSDTPRRGFFAAHELDADQYFFWEETGVALKVEAVDEPF